MKVCSIISQDKVWHPFAIWCPLFHIFKLLHFGLLSCYVLRTSHYALRSAAKKNHSSPSTLASPVATDLLWFMNMIDSAS